MGKITNIRSTSKDKVQVTLDMTQSEVMWLAGNLDKMFLFSNKNLETRTRLVQRGKRDSTKYFLMPKELRDDVIPSNSVMCTRMEDQKNCLFIFSVPKVA